MKEVIYLFLGMNSKADLLENLVQDTVFRQDVYFFTHRKPR